MIPDLNDAMTKCRIDILTIFPDFFRGPLDYGIVRRARETGLVEINIHDLRILRKTSTAPWMTAHLAAARAWSLSRNRSLNVWSSWSLARQRGAAEARSSR